MRATHSDCLITNQFDLSGLARQVELDGYAIFPRIAADRETISVAAALGEPMTPWNDAVTQVLTPRANSTPNTYSGIFGLDRFPFHTDLAHWPRPPRFLLLRCIRGYADVPTLLVDGREIASAVGRDDMSRALMKPRRPRHGEMRMQRLLQTVDDGEIIRWDEVFLRPASPVGSRAVDCR